MATGATWFEVVGKDGAALKRFYSQLFDRELEDYEGYGMLTNPDHGVGGGIGQAQQGEGHVTFYVSVDDPQAYLDKAAQLGGKTIVPVTAMEMVTFALFADPEGHLVGVVKGEDAS